MMIAVVNPLEYPDWDEQVKGVPGHSLFHSSPWADVLWSSYRYAPVGFTLSRGGTIRSLVTVTDVRSRLTGHRGVSLAFSDYCEPLAANLDDFVRLFGRMIEHGAKAGWSRIELRGGDRFLSGVRPSATYLGHTLKLDRDTPGLLASFHETTRRNIRKADREGVKTEVATSLPAVAEFYRLHCLTRRKHGVPPQPFDFFRNLHERIIDRGQGIVVLGCYRGEVIAASICGHFGERAIYKFGASDERFQHVRANNLVMWEAIQWYSRLGCTSFCFGRTDADAEGLRRFKAGWGADERLISYYTYELAAGGFSARDRKGTGKANRILQRVPQPILNMIGRMLYRHMG